MSGFQGIAVYCEVKEGGLLPIAAEALGIGRKLAESQGQPLSALLLGSNIGGLAQQAIAAGADKVYVVDSPLLKDYVSDAFVDALEKAVGQVKPQVLIMGQTDAGRELAPRLAFRLGTAATLDCVDLAIDPETKRLLQTKPVYGGNARAVYTCDTDPQVVTIRTKAFGALAPDPSRRGEVVSLAAAPDAQAIRTRVLERKVEETAGIKLEDATVVVPGGGEWGGRRASPSSRSWPGCSRAPWAPAGRPAITAGCRTRCRLALPARSSPRRSISPWPFPVPAST